MCHMIKGGCRLHFGVNLAGVGALGQQGGGSLCVMYWASVLFTGCCVVYLSVKIDKASTFPVLVLLQ